MTKTIAFLITGHSSKDERVYFHQARSLSNIGYQIHIVSTKEDLQELNSSICIHSFNSEGLSQKDKIKNMVEFIGFIRPDIIICDSPLSVIASNLYKKKKTVKIIYDVTEWYPSKKNLRNQHFSSTILKFITLTFLSFFAGIKSDSFIFGEFYKSIPFRVLFCWKKYLYLPYYPDLNYIQYYPPEKIENEINCLYSGIITNDKGIDSIIGAIDIASKELQHIQFNLHVIGVFPLKSDQQNFDLLCSKLNTNVHVDYQALLPFQDYCKVIGNTHLFFDLRQIDLENTYCLPIKLFYYLACGRPIIYSNLKSIRKEIKNFNFGYLCRPNNLQSISNQIIEYIVHPDKYLTHSNNAFNISRTSYNWSTIENNFISFLGNVN